MEEKQYEWRFNLIKEKNILIKKYTNNNKPLLLFNSIDNEKPVININSMVMVYQSQTDEDKENGVYFGDLAGSFENYNEKSNFNFFMSKTIIENKSHIWERDFKFFLDWINEIWVLLEGLNDAKILNWNSIKIYKFEAPDFIVSLNDEEIWGIEVTHSDTDNSQWFLKNFYPIQKKQKEKGFEEYLNNLELKYYQEITKPNIKNIEEHFSKINKYKNSVERFYSNKLIKIFYFITLGGGARFTEGEKENLNEIKFLVNNYKIEFENIFVQIGHKTGVVKWLTLNEILTDLNLINN